MVSIYMEFNIKKQECLWDIPAAGKEFKPSHLSDM